MTQRVQDLDTYDGAHLTMTQMKTYFGVDRRTIIKWVDVLGLVAHKFGEEWRFKTTDVRAFVAKHRLTKTSDDASPRPTTSASTTAQQ